MQVRRGAGVAGYVIRLSQPCIHWISMKRVVEEEWLDRDLGTSEEIDSALRAITLANRRFGGVRLHARLLQRALARVTHGSRPHILEVASGRGDVLRAALQRLGCGVPDVMLLDRSASHLPDPRAWPAGLPTPRILAGDALELPFPDSSVDIVSCCLFLHHLEPPQNRALPQGSAARRARRRGHQRPGAHRISLSPGAVEPHHRSQPHLAPRRSGLGPPRLYPHANSTACSRTPAAASISNAPGSTGSARCSGVDSRNSRVVRHISASI